MASRLELHEELCEILGSRNVYFQPPSSLTMKYDAIRYSLSGKDLKRASDRVYIKTNEYEGVIITRKPDTNIPDAMIEHFAMCSVGNPYVKDNLNHFPFTLYY